MTNALLKKLNTMFLFYVQKVQASSNFNYHCTRYYLKKKRYNFEIFWYAYDNHIFFNL